jgi:predicted HTH domain antitoxin
MTIRFELPTDIERELDVPNGADLGLEAKEAYLVELYRQERIHHHQLAEALGLSRSEADAVLKRHKVPSGPATVAELRAEVAALRDARPE